MAAIVLGLDGANWDMIRPFLSSGELPNLERLIDEGIGGTSMSTLPPTTVPNWKCYATGKYPGKLGVFHFDRVKTTTREHIFHGYRDFKSSELWDYLNDEGYMTGIINKPSTYPPRPVDGFMIAGGPDATDGEYRRVSGGFATPDELEEYLLADYDYRIHPSPLLSPSDNGPEEIEAAINIIKMRFDVARDLLKRWDPDFLHLTVFYNMVLQHYFWTEEPVRRAWKVIDNGIGRFLDEGHDLIVISDHGTSYVERVFYINVWLEEHGYQRTHANIDERLRRIGFTRERALYIAKRLNLVDTLAKIVPESIQKIVPWKEGVKGERILDAVDWRSTQAIASSQGPIYINIPSDSTRYEPIRDELINELSGLQHPMSGEELITDVYRGEEFYSGDYASEAPDLLVEQAPNTHVSNAIGPDSWYSDEGVWKGGNMPTGIFLASGPSFRTDGLELDIEIVDIAPTILHLMGVAIPNDLDGEVVDVFDEESVPGNNNINFREPIERMAYGEKAAERGVEERLESLGYME